MTINEQLDNLSKDMRTDMGIICRIVYRRCQQYTLDEMKDIIDEIKDITCYDEEALFLKSKVLEVIRNHMDYIRNEKINII